MGGSHRTEPIRVLHVDDEPDFAEMAADFLEREDDRFTVRTATDASEALDVLAGDGIDCVISDYDMPGRNGIEFLETVREDHPELPFVLFTGKGSEEVASEAISAGATDYLQKETGTEKYELLANRVRNAVDQYRATRRAAELDRVRTLASDINQELVRAGSRAEIEARVCEIVSDSDPYLFAWIGEVDPETGRIEPRASAGIDGEYLDAITVTADETPTGRGPGGTAIRERRVAVSQNVAEDPAFEPWRREALEHGFRAVAAVPLEYETALYGELVVYADRSYAFDGDERELLAELGDDIAHAIHSLEVREQLRTERDRRRALFENSPDPVLAGEIRGDGSEHRITGANDAFREVFGYDPEDVLGRDIAEVTVPDEGMDRHERFRERARRGEPTTAEVERVTADGPREFLLHVIPFETDGEPAEGWYAWYTDITERKQQERRLEAITKATRKDAIYLKDTEGRYRFINDAGATVFNRDPEDVIGKRAAELYDSVDGDRLPEDLEVLETEEPITYEVTRTVDGETRHFEAEKQPYYEDGELFGLVGISRDITRRKERARAIENLHDTARAVLRAETKAEVAEIVVEDIETLLDMPVNGVWFHDEAESVLRPVAWTERATEVIGDLPTFSPGEGLAWEAFERGESTYYEDVSTVPGRLNPETPIRSEIILPIGEYGIITIGSTEPDEFGDVDISLARTVAAHAGTALDRIERETMLRREREVVERLFETSPVAITIVGADGTIQRANEHAERVLGITRSEITDRTYDDPEWRIVDNDGDPIPPEDLPFRRVLETGEPVFDYEHGIEWPDGTRRWLSINAAPLTIGDGDVERVIAVTKDVTDQREQRRELLRQNDRLEEFTGVVSHDLRNPLNVAQGRLELARADGDSEHLDGVATALDRMETLIEDLLALAREGERVSDLEPVDLADTVEGCWRNVETARATLVAGTDRTIRADHSRLQQLLENLFRNAVEHGGEDVTITVGDLDGGFFVADDGQGIPEDKRERVFESGVSTSEGGTGFGLAIAREIADAHGWEIRATESEEGGARFEVTGVETVRDDP